MNNNKKEAIKEVEIDGLELEFLTEELKNDKEIEKDYIDIDSFVIYMCLDGNFTIVYDTDQSIQVKKGETILVPACLKNIFRAISKNIFILLCLST